MSLYRRHRPQKFAQVTGQDHVCSTLKNELAAGTVAHAYLFTGPRGIGKTTMARLLAKAVNCEKPVGNEPCNVCTACEEITAGRSLDVMEIDAASHTDVEHVREHIIRNAQFAPSKLNRKVFIIDEVHMLSTSSFNALLKTLEEPPAHALFILATTEIHKVPSTIISRCQRFDFRRIEKKELVERLDMIAKAEGVKAESNVLEAVAKYADGSARDAESLLEQLIALGEKKITMEVAGLVIPVTNMVLVRDFLAALFVHDATGCFGLINAAVEQGMDLPALTDDFIDELRARMVDGLCGKKQEVTTVFLRKAIEVFLHAHERSRRDRIPQLALELAVVELCEGKEKNFKDPKPPLAPPCKGGESSSCSSPLQGEVRRGLVEDFVIEPKATALGTVPVLDLDDVRQKWPQVFEQIKACSASLPMVVQTCEVAGVNGNEVELSFAYELYAETANQDKNRSVIEGVLEKVLGRPVIMRAKHSKEKQDEVVGELLEEFGGVEG